MYLFSRTVFVASLLFDSSFLRLRQARVSELEHEAEELRQLWRSESSSRSGLLHGLLLLNPEEESAGEPAAAAARSPAVLKRWASERLMKAPREPDSPGGLYDHECSCARRAEVLKHRGVSLLTEVDAQYSALQVKYDELLRRCQLEEEDGLGHAPPEASGAAAARGGSEDGRQQPEYKELFRKIFSRIQRTEEELNKNRGRPSAAAR